VLPGICGGLPFGSIRNSQAIRSSFCRGADVAKFAAGAIGLAGGAATAAMEDQPVAEVGPGLLREEFHQIPLDANWVAEFREAKALGEAADMGVHHDSFVF
jgi:hypothetical protein